MDKVDMTRYYDLIFLAICHKLTSAERIELDDLKTKLAARKKECRVKP